MLAFLPPRLDLTTSWISLVAWFLLVLELLFEVFIRPSGYSALIHSEKAYAPSTDSCSYASTLNLMNATFLVSLAQYNTILSLNSYPRKAVFVGNCTLATLRLRVFGIVRFWKRMWINRSSIQSSSGFFHRFIPPKAINLHPADCDLGKIKEQLRKEAMEQASVAFESRLQMHFVEFDKLICAKIELSFLQQKWSEALRQFKLELDSMSARCDQGKTQQQCM
jgi:hypothetical protein